MTPAKDKTTIETASTGDRTRNSRRAARGSAETGAPHTAGTSSTAGTTPSAADVLAAHVEVQTHFARSANLERDHGQPISDYLPTARAREVLRRIIAGINDPASGRALSITGTYGTGKSSLALFLDALLGPTSLAQDSADEVLEAIDPALYEAAVEVRSSLPGGAILVAPITAQREPVTATLLRALHTAVQRLPEAAQETKACQAILAADNAEDLDLIALLDGLAHEHAVLLIVDEFGKNLEEFVATGGRDADLFVLQAIAEWTTDRRHHPVLLLTLQHLAFNEYDADGTRGREWSKIQGRFVDIPYVESSAETQTLISSVHKTTLDVADWSAACTNELDRIGVADLVHIDPAEMYPLHPTLVAALPSLCSRYGQNERTLFSFLAGPDAHAVPSFLATTPLTDGPLPSVRLHHAYDFFLASASTMVGASPHASRWIEIETRMRDTAGLSDPELRVLKTIGVLNLIAAGGSLRASRHLVRVAAVDEQPGTATAKAVDKVLDTLTERGLLTYREFADEYRIWAGTDYDLKSAVELARRRITNESIAVVLNRVRPQTPVVAARHSQEFGVLRVFTRHFVDDVSGIPTLTGQDYDGLVLLSVALGGGEAGFDISRYPAILDATASRPVVVGAAGAENVEALIEAALDLAAYQDALKHAESANIDWVARRELAERTAAAAARLDVVIENAYGVGAADVRWYTVTADSADGAKASSHLINTAAERSKGARTLASVLSDVCDERYPRTPRMRNEMLSRRMLTSQGAKARRDLLEAMIEHSEEPLLAIEGFGPERAMYDAVLAKPGIHRSTPTGSWAFGAPTDGDAGLGYQPAWQAIVEMLQESASEQITVFEVYARLMAPPFGLKEGPIPVLVTAALIESAASVAIYENGTFLTRLDVPAVERLIRNPKLFTLRQYAVSGQRAQVAGRLAETLGTKTFAHGQRVGELVGVVGVLLGRARALPVFGQKTKVLSDNTRRVRSALTTATDPEQLLFEDLPAAVGMPAFGRNGASRADDVETFIDRIVAGLEELRELYPAMREGLITRIGSELAASGTATEIRVALQTRFGRLKAMPLETRLQTFLQGLVDDALDDEGWAEYIGMLLLNKPPESWTDGDVDAAHGRATRLCQQLRNVESLHFDHKGGTSGEGTTAMRIGITRADGKDVSRVVHINSASLSVLDAVTADALAKIDAQLGGTGREALLARLAETVLGSEADKQPVSVLAGRVSNESDQRSTNQANGRTA